MARNDIVFVKGNGANKRVAAGQDYISGLVLYSGTLPSGFTTTKNIKQLFSLQDAVNLGINTTNSDETKATATYLVTNVGSNGDTLKITVNEPLGVVTNLGTYTKVSGDTTVTKVGDAIALMINDGTKNHGYTATASTGTVTITAKTGLGVSLNSGAPLVVTIVGTIAGTLTAFSGGVGSRLAVYHYHISEFFRANPTGQLWVGIFPVPGTYTFAEITTLQKAANGALRQVGVFKDSAAYASSDLTAINTEVVTNCDNKHMPLSVLYAADLTATADITQIADLSTLSANKVSSIIGQDGAALGALLFHSYGKSITHLGVALGMLSRSAVSEDFGEPSKFNISNGVENDVPAFANGQLVSALSDNALDALFEKRQISAQKYVGYAGTFFNDNHTAISTTSDYAYINDNRVMDKAIRGIYASLIPYLKSRLIYNADGSLASTTINFLSNQALQPLLQMSRDNDLGAVESSDVYIDPTQDVRTTSTLNISVVLNENGIARNILVPITFK